MTSHAPLLQFALLSGFVLAITLAMLIAACERPLRRLLVRQAPKQRARLMWWLLVTPALAGIGYMVVTIAMPSVLHDSAKFAAACSAHSDSLWHLCVWHPSENGEVTWLWAVLALLMGYAAWLVARAARSVWRVRQTLVTMLRLSRRSGHADNRLHVVDVEQPLAFACGIGRGHVVLSQSLLDRLDAMQLRVVLAHEQAHLKHRDVFWRLIAVFLSGIHLPGVRRRLLRDQELALEQRCDFVAAAAVGCPVIVAEAIVAVEKIFRHHAIQRMPLSMAFLSDFVPERVQALLSPDRESTSYLGSLLGFAVVMFCGLSAGWLHHFTESLIALLAW